MKISILSLVALLSANYASATYGVDLSSLGSTSAYSCLKSDGFSFAIPRAWCSYGGNDANIKSNIANARSAGISYVDVYMFPCRGKSASDQVSQMMSNLGIAKSMVEEPIPYHPQAKGMSAGSADDINDEDLGLEIESDFMTWRAANVDEGVSNGSNFGMVWIDVEDNPSSGCSWNSYSDSSNCDYLNSLISAVKSYGKVAGVYTSQYEWSSVMGSQGACTSANGVQLWYAHYDNKASFSDYVKIGGWSKPAIKQYAGDVSLCGLGIDKSFY
jgi:hypothetical protein